MRDIKAITHIICIFLLLAMIGVLPTGLSTGTSHAEEVVQPAPLGLEEQADTASPNQEYLYEMEGRPDPFEPFITPKAISTAPQLDPNEIVDDNNKVLTGMQLFEPGQLTLTAILMTGNDSMALVEDVTGKGYVLREGILIGSRGIVTSIDQAGVIITETAKTRAGKEVKTTITMKINKEGDE